MNVVSGKDFAHKNEHEYIVTTSIAKDKDQSTTAKSISEPEWKHVHEGSEITNTS